MRMLASSTKSPVYLFPKVGVSNIQSVEMLCLVHEATDRPPEIRRHGQGAWFSAESSDTALVTLWPYHL